MTTFAEHVDDYLRLRRALGFKLDEHARLLPKFAAHLDATGAKSITVELALGWATEPNMPAGSVVPAMGLLVAATYETLIGLLAATGMRISEAINLDDADVDWREGVLLVRESKFNKSRYLPLHVSTLDAIERYAHERDRLCPDRRDASFFSSLRRRRLDDCAVHATFRRLCDATGIGAGAPYPPRLHDLRHTMAVKTLLAWYRDGVDVHSRLPALSTYLGHLNPAYTYYYLSAAPELLAHAAGLLDTAQEARP
jgi:integrase